MKSTLITCFIFLMVYFSSCEKHRTIVETQVLLSYVDITGNDLLDPANPNGFKEANIDLYYMINGVKTRVLDGNMDSPEGFRIYYAETQKKYILAFSANTHFDSKKMSETLIDFGDYVDTISASWDVSDNGLVINEIWFNQKYCSIAAKLITITVE